MTIPTRPVSKPNEVLCKLRYCGLNRADLMHAARPAGSAPSIPGMDWCGDVVEVGAEVRGFKTGDRVMCSGSGPGGYAEYAVTDWGRVLPAPAGLGDEQAAVTMLALQTMHDALIVPRSHAELAREAIRGGFRRYFQEVLGMPAAPLPIIPEG